MRSLVNKLGTSSAAARVRRLASGTPAEAALKRTYAVLAIAAWRLDATRPPPPQYKISELRRYARRYHLRRFVETGTFEGDTVAAMLPEVDRAWTIELSTDLHAAAVARFASDPRVSVLLGDSSDRLSDVLAELDRPALFWLDAHYSEGTTALGDRESPAESELRSIVSHHVRGHVILIDDAREFDGTRGYPSLAEVRTLVRDADPHATVDVRNDLIRIHSIARP